MNIIECITLYKLKMLGGEKLPNIAMMLIEAGNESQYLYDLAWENNPTLADAGPLFEKGLNEIGIKIPSKTKALENLLIIYCKKIISNELTPYDGARKIWQDICDDNDAPEKAYDFVTYADALNNHGDNEAIKYFNEIIVKEAQEVVSQVNV